MKCSTHRDARHQHVLKKKLASSTTNKKTFRQLYKNHLPQYGYLGVKLRKSSQIGNKDGKKTQQPNIILKNEKLRE